MLSLEMKQVTRTDLVRILGEPVVAEAERMSPEQFTEKKWDRLPELLRACEKFYDTSLFEARRSFLLGLDPDLRRLLVRHLLDEPNQFPL